MTRHTQGVIPAAKAVSDWLDALPARRAADTATADAMRDRMARQQRDFWARRDAAQGGL